MSTKTTKTKAPKTYRLRDAERVAKNCNRPLREILGRPEFSHIPMPEATAYAETKRSKGGAKAKPEKAAKEPKAPRAPKAKAEKPFEHDARAPAVGTTIEKSYKGKDLKVKVLADGFEFDGTKFRSISGVAKAITGAKTISGPLFFGWVKPTRKTA